MASRKPRVNKYVMIHDLALICLLRLRDPYE